MGKEIAFLLIMLCHGWIKLNKQIHSLLNLFRWEELYHRRSKRFTFFLLLRNFNISILTRSFLSFQEVGSIIGKKGEIVKRFREEVRNENSKSAILFRTHDKRNGSETYAFFPSLRL